MQEKREKNKGAVDPATPWAKLRLLATRGHPRLHFFFQFRRPRQNTLKKQSQSYSNSISTEVTESELECRYLGSPYVNAFDRSGKRSPNNYFSVL